MTTDAPDRIAVFSDIHGNLHALEAVLQTIDEMQIEHMVCCGDVVGYGAFPNECVEVLREREIPTLAGNHDHAALEWTDIRFFNHIAREAVVWTREHLSEDNKAWLRQRPYTYDLGGLYYCVHSSPVRPRKWGYVLTFTDALRCFEQFDQRFCFIGHSHQPAAVVHQDGELTLPTTHQVPLAPNARYLINVGSVGQPRDRNPRACFVTVDLSAGQIEFQRVSYDIEGAQRAIQTMGLPIELAERLGYGF